MDRDFIGVYSRVVQGMKTYFYVWQKGDMYSVQRLDKQFNATDILKTLDEKNFKNLFVHEPNIRQRPGARKVLNVEETLENLPKGGKVEDVLREHFRKALLRLRRADSKASGLASIQTLLEVEEGITPEHKHLFMEFGVNMRKNQYYDEALAFCKRSLSLAPQDDHAHFNAARILMDMGRYDEAEQHLLTAQDINNNVIYRKALAHIERIRLQPMDTETLRKLLDEELF